MTANVSNVIQCYLVNRDSLSRPGGERESLVFCSGCFFEVGFFNFPLSEFHGLPEEPFTVRVKSDNFGQFTAACGLPWLPWLPWVPSALEIKNKKSPFE